MLAGSDGAARPSGGQGLDLCRVDDVKPNELRVRLRVTCERANGGTGLSFEIEPALNCPTISFYPDGGLAVREAIRRLDDKHMGIVSDAGYDACYVARVAPTGVISVLHIWRRKFRRKFESRLLGLVPARTQQSSH